MFIAPRICGVRNRPTAENRLVDKQKDKLGDASNPKPYKFTNYWIKI
jgi:hypothetical protein